MGNEKRGNERQEKEMRGVERTWKKRTGQKRKGTERAMKKREAEEIRGNQGEGRTQVSTNALFQNALSTPMTVMENSSTASRRGLRECGRGAEATKKKGWK
jgi:hypothetical protein